MAPLGRPVVIETTARGGAVAGHFATVHAFKLATVRGGLVAGTAAADVQLTLRLRARPVVATAKVVLLDILEGRCWGGGTVRCGAEPWQQGGAT